MTSIRVGTSVAHDVLLRHGKSHQASRIEKYFGMAEGPGDDGGVSVDRIPDASAPTLRRR
jgi:hypothetical protein